MYSFLRLWQEWGNLIGEGGEGAGLDPDGSRTPELHDKPLSSCQEGSDVADLAHVVVDVVGEGHQVAGVYY